MTKLAIKLCNYQAAVQSLREAFAQDLIEDELVWLEMIDDRNKTTHLYSQEEAERIANMIVEQYFGELESLLQKLLLRV